MSFWNRRQQFPRDRFQTLDCVADADEARRIPAQQLPVIRFQNPDKVSEVAFYGIDVGILPVEKDLDIAIRTVEFQLQAIPCCVLIKSGRLSQQVDARFIANHVLARRCILDCDAADYEFLVKPVAAFLQVATVGHLRYQVGRPEQMTADGIPRVIEFDVVQIELVAGEMHDHTGNADILCHTEFRKVAAQEIGTA